MKTYRELLAYDDSEMARVDPGEMNLLVAKSIASFADLHIPHYLKVLDSLAKSAQQFIHQNEHHFCEAPHDWKNDIAFFRLGLLCQFLEMGAGIEYNEEQRFVQSMRYTDPIDLFLNGILDTGRGTCANMAALHVAVGRRLGWPVSIACVNSHYICRYDDGRSCYNIEATQSGHGGFKSDPDEYLIRHHCLPSIAIRSGSDLRALNPREVLGVFIGLRGRHMRDIGNYPEAELDYLLARYLFPTSRRLYIDALAIITGRGSTLFQPGEIGSPDTLHLLERDYPTWSPRINREERMQCPCSSFEQAIPMIAHQTIDLGSGFDAIDHSARSLHNSESG